MMGFTARHVFQPAHHVQTDQTPRRTPALLLPPLTTPRAQTQADSLLDSRYTTLPIQVLDPVRDLQSKHRHISMPRDQDSDLSLERSRSHIPPSPPILPRPQQHTPQLEGPRRRRFFDPREDDPIRSSIMARPTRSTSQTARPPTILPQPTVDCVSIFSASSYAQSSLYSDTALSADELETKGTVLSAQLKRLYREISVLEGEVTREDGDEAPDEHGITFEGQERKDGSSEGDRWKRVLVDHKK